jgi:hypothetical protein
MSTRRFRCADGQRWASVSWLSAPVFVVATGCSRCCSAAFRLSVYPLIVHGKPYDWRTLPAFMPPSSNSRSFFSVSPPGFALLMNQLPKWYHPVFNWERLSGPPTTTSSSSSARNPKFSESKTRELLEGRWRHVT